jgi:hypothetical protein
MLKYLTEAAERLHANTGSHADGNDWRERHLARGDENGEMAREVTELGCEEMQVDVGSSK